MGIGRTIAVMGTPLSHQYPKSNTLLRKEIAKNHLAKVNKWSDEITEQYINLSKDIFVERSKHEWHLNFEWLTKEGVNVKPKR